MQTLVHKNIHLTYILLTEHISFLPFNILQRAQCIPFVRPTKIMYNKCIHKKTKQKDMSLIRNIKNLHVNVTQLIKPHSFISEKIIKSIYYFKNTFSDEKSVQIHDLGGSDLHPTFLCPTPI